MVAMMGGTAYHVALGSQQGRIQAIVRENNGGAQFVLLAGVAILDVLLARLPVDEQHLPQSGI